MHAIGIHLLENNQDINVLYVSSEMFTNELIKEDIVIDYTFYNNAQTDLYHNEYENQQILQEEMENACQMKVRLRADVNTGKTWYDAKG
mgnify:CR=1 FL=1